MFAASLSPTKQTNQIADQNKFPQFNKEIKPMQSQLNGLDVWLDKAEQHAAAKNFDVGMLM